MFNVVKRARRNSRQRGATLYEFAAILPILLFIMVGIIDFGRAMYAYHFVANAARQATRWASVRGVDCNAFPTACPAQASDILNYVQKLAPPGIFISSNSGCASGTVGCLTINQSTSFIWPGTTTTNGSNTSCLGGGSNPSNAAGCVVQVQVAYTWGSGIPLIPYTLVLSSTSQFVISN
jgi:Flp pilus assembly protein TadG